MSAQLLAKGKLRSGRRPLPPAEDRALTSADPLALFRALERSDRFRRDTRLGGIFHTGKISFRELTPTDSLHIVIDGTRVSAHVDEISPLDFCEDGSVRYSLGRVLAHNVSVARGDLMRRLAGTHGAQRCNMACEVVWVDDDEAIAEVTGDCCDDPSGEGHLSPGSGMQPEHSPATDTLQVPFSLVDEAVHLLDTEAAPWSVQLEARVSGRLDEARLRAALGASLAAHPMARARKLPSRPSMHQDRWEIRPDVDLDPLRVVDCPDDTALAAARAELQSRPVPLAESPPLRARLARHPDGDVVMLNVNHAAMDGFGARRVLLSVARAYAGDRDPSPEVEFLESRELPVRLADAAAATRVRRWLALAERLRGLAVPPARLAPDGGADEEGYGFHQVSLPPAQASAMGRSGSAGTDSDGRVTDGRITDVLAGALNLAIAGWNADHGHRCGRIGVLLANNLRPPSWGDDMVGNFSLPARVSTTAHDRRSRGAALAALTAQTRRKRRTGMGTAVIEVLGRSSLFPLWAKQTVVTLLPLTGNRLVDTAMLCDLGELAHPLSFGPDAGETVEVWFSPPARMPIGLAVGAVTAGGRLHLSFRYRRRLLGAEAAGRLVDRFLAELELLLGTTASTETVSPRP